MSIDPVLLDRNAKLLLVNDRICKISKWLITHESTRKGKSKSIVLRLHPFWSSKIPFKCPFWICTLDAHSVAPSPLSQSFDGTTQACAKRPYSYLRSPQPQKLAPLSLSPSLSLSFFHRQKWRIMECRDCFIYHTQYIYIMELRETKRERWNNMIIEGT